MKERVQKLLARAGLGSRRACEQLIREGRVAVDGVVVSELGVKADPGNQTVAFDGQPIRLDRRVYYLLHKPRGFVCSASSDQGRPRAIDLVPTDPRVYTVGRLDVESEGAIIVTNDGELTNLLTHPRYEVPRTYRVKVSGRPSPVAIQKLRAGVHLAEGKTQPAEVRVKRHGKDVTTFDITVSQGLNRQVRRMLAKVDLKVRQLVRIQIGPVRLKTLPVGASRPLRRQEINALRRAALEKRPGKSRAPPAEPKKKRKTERPAAKRKVKTTRREPPTPKPTARRRRVVE